MRKPIPERFGQRGIAAIFFTGAEVPARREIADRISPGFYVDTHIPMGMTDWGGVIFQVRKRRQRDEGLQRNILSAALSISLGMKLAIAVDEDIDIYEPEDVLSSSATRPWSRPPRSGCPTHSTARQSPASSSRARVTP